MQNKNHKVSVVCVDRNKNDGYGLNVHSVSSGGLMETYGDI